MFARLGYPKRLRAAFLIVLMAIGLSAGVIGPAISLPKKDGYIAICTGAEIVYIPAAELGFDFPGESVDETSGDTDSAQSERCPWFGQAEAIETAPPVLLPDGPRDRAEPPQIGAITGLPAPKRAFLARAPPLSLI